MEKSNISEFKANDFEEFQSFVKEAPGLVVIDFFATWCGPCQRLLNQLPSLAKEFPDVLFVEVNAEACPAISKKFSFYSYPTIFFVKSKEGEIQKFGSVTGAYLDRIRSKVVEFKDPNAIPSESGWGCFCQIA